MTRKSMRRNSLQARGSKRYSRGISLPALTFARPDRTVTLQIHGRAESLDRGSAMSAAFL